ncbi:MAG: hypothetical protein Q8Q13_00185 [bacterium]|nr:hypothetical protein [bacterium]
MLDRAVDACYGPPSRKASEGHGKKNFKSEPERLEFLADMIVQKMVGSVIMIYCAL